MSRFQKARHRDRLRTVDSVITTLKAGLESVQQNCYVLDKVIERTPKESEMTPKDKYWIFDKKAKGYRKSVHRQPKWTKLTNRVPPAHF
jgi:hypothetical protein